MWKEFREFAVKGSVVDLAVGVIIGGAFGKIVSSLVNDIMMPPIGLLLGRVDFSNLFISLNGKSYISLDAAEAAGAPLLRYGQFINNVINFLIVAFTVFIFVRQINRLRRKKETPAAKEPTRICPECCSEVPLEAQRCKYCTSSIGSVVRTGH